MKGNIAWVEPHLSQIFFSKRGRILFLFILIILLLTPSLVYLQDHPRFIGINAPDSHVNHGINWSRFAYTQYATTPEYLCNSLMLFASLHRLNSNASRLLMYSSDIHLTQEGESEPIESRLLRKARDEYNVKLKPVRIQQIAGAERESAYHSGLS